jgi:hypothetical protein
MVAPGLVLLALIAVGVYGAVSSRGGWTWPSLAGTRTAAPSAPAVIDAALGVPTGGELELAAARRLVSSGDLRGALSALDRVRRTDRQKGEADRLRTDIQRQLLRSLSDGPAAPAAGDSVQEPRP